jgi:hypothetical protein
VPVARGVAGVSLLAAARYGVYLAHTGMERGQATANHVSRNKHIARHARRKYVPGLLWLLLLLRRFLLHLLEKIPTLGRGRQRLGRVDTCLLEEKLLGRQDRAAVDLGGHVHGGFLSHCRGAAAGVGGRRRQAVAHGAGVQFDGGLGGRGRRLQRWHRCCCTRRDGVGRLGWGGE